MDNLIEIYTLGRLRIQRCHTEPVDFRTKKYAALFVYLACTGQSHPRDVLAEMFWPDRSTDASRSNLRAALTDLRKQAGSILNVSRDMVEIEPHESWWLDLRVLEEGLRQQRGEVLNADSFKDLLDLYQGDFLDGFYIDSPTFENWVFLERERIRSQIISGAEQLITYYLQNAAYTAGASLASRLLQIDPLYEPAVRHLMRFHALSGNRSAAIHQFEAWRMQLYDELGVEPEDGTLALYQEIRQGNVSSPVATPSELIRHHIPSPSTPLVGREQEISQLISQIRKPESRLITIVGPGGIGKTRLALAVAQTLVDTEQTEIMFVSLGDGHNPMLSLARALGLGADADHATILHFLKGRQNLVLILDDVTPSDHLSLFVKNADHGTILATAREPLQLYGEQLFPIDGLASDGAATELFIQAAQRANPSFDDLEAIPMCCQLVDGIPLAVELAASWTSLLPVAEIVQEIQKNLDFLETKLTGVPEQHRSMRAVFESTWQRLSSDEQSGFAELAIFSGGFTREAAQAVTGLTLHMLGALVNKFLVRYDSDENRYSMHALLRQFCIEKLEENPAWLSDVRERHSTYFCNLLAEPKHKLAASAMEESVARLERDSANLLDAWRWAIDNENAHLLVDSAEVFGVWCDTIGHYREAEELFEAVVNWIHGINEPGDEYQLLLAQALYWKATFGRRLRYPDDLLYPTVRESLERFDQLESDYDVYSSMGFVMNTLIHVAPLDEISTYYERGLKLFGKRGDVRGQGFINASMGYRLLRNHNITEAETYFSKALTHFQRAVCSCPMDTLLGSLANVLFAQAKIDQLQRLADLMLATYRNPQVASYTAISSKATGILLQMLGRFEESMSCAEEGLLLANTREIQHRVPGCRVLVSEGHLHLGRYGMAEITAQQGLAMARQTGQAVAEGSALHILSHLAVVDGRWDEARKFAAQSIGIPHPWGQKGNDAIGLVSLALIDIFQGKYQDARQKLVDRLVPVGPYYYSVLVWFLPVFALWYAAQDDMDEALKFYAVARQQPFVGNSKWFGDVIGIHIPVSSSTQTVELNFWDAIAILRERFLIEN